MQFLLRLLLLCLFMLRLLRLGRLLNRLPDGQATLGYKWRAPRTCFSSSLCMSLLPAPSRSHWLRHNCRGGDLAFAAAAVRPNCP